MAKSLRDWIEVLEANDLLYRVKEEVPIQQLASIIAQNTQKATLFENIADYDMPLVANTFSNRDMMKLALETDEEHIMQALDQRTERRIDPVYLDSGPCQEVVITADDVNLAALPLHFQHDLDAAPYISASVFVSKDPQHQVHNMGVYRMMYRKRNETGVDVTAPHKMRKYCQQAFEKGQPLEVAVLLGLPTIDIMSCMAPSPFDVDEFEVLGGFRGEPVELVKCKTVDLYVPANAEIVLEGEIQPVGWTEDEGPYGEFTGTYGAGLKWNPTVKIKAITHRKNPIFHSATHGGMYPGWTDVHVIFPIIEHDLYKAMRSAGIDVRAVRVIPAAACNWAVASIKTLSAGDSKNALALMLAASKQAMPKFAVVVDEDIDIFSDEQLYWAMTWRTQPHEDMMILRDMKAVPLDPSLPSTMPPVTTSKMGWDATIPVGKNRADYAPCFPLPFDADAEVQRAGLSEAELESEIVSFIKSNAPCHFNDILKGFNGNKHRAILEAFGRIRERDLLGRDEDGRYVLQESSTATPPGRA